MTGFELTADELAAIDGLNTGRRGYPEPADVTPPDLSDATFPEA